ncbi:MAG: DUF86 domain-containing protein [Deltaproteobacteria bacterium]|nr:DUF86 domain-containing protein [Deltaproteobacteria bacterium]
MNRDIRRLQDILLCINKIEKYSKKGRKAFDENELVQAYFTYHLQIIGEAARALTEKLKMKLSNIDWHEIIGMRNVIVHEYLDVDYDQVWDTIQKDLPKLREDVLKVLKILKS